MRRPIRAAAVLTALLALTASGCVTVHGESAVVPSATRSEAARALKDFTDAYNKADQAYDPALDADRVTGSLGAINQAGLKARSITSPGGNPDHRSLVLTDAKYTIPRTAGWPRWFVADADSEHDQDGGPQDNRWLLVFLRNGPAQRWQAAYLTILSPDRIPAFATDKDGWAEAVAPDSAALSVAPKALSAQYASYLESGRPAHFAAGPHTDGWRESRAKNVRLPGLTTQFIDQPVGGGDFAPLGLATKGGGAMVFFATRFFDRQTAAEGYRPTMSPEEQALLTGTMGNTLTREWITSQAAAVPRRGAVVIAGRLQGITGAKGS